MLSSDDDDDDYIAIGAHGLSALVTLDQYWRKEERVGDEAE